MLLRLFAKVKIIDMPILKKSKPGDFVWLFLHLQSHITRFLSNKDP